MGKYDDPYTKKAKSKWRQMGPFRAQARKASAAGRRWSRFWKKVTAKPPKKRKDQNQPNGCGCGGCLVVILFLIVFLVIVAANRK
jgi:hypothetical protein